MNKTQSMVLAVVCIIAFLGVSLPSSSAQSSIEIEILARGTTGTEVVNLVVDGQVGATWTLATTDQTFRHSHVGSIEGDIRVQFTNDDSNFNGRDRNVFVDWLRVDGTQYETEDPGVFSTGSWTTATRCAPGFKQQEWLVCNGYVQFSVEPVTLAAPEVLVRVQARGSTGTEQIEVSVNDEVVDSFVLTTDMATYAVTLDETVSTLKVRFMNDGLDQGRDRNVTVDWVDVDGTQYETEDPGVFSTGTWTDGTRCAPGFKQLQDLHCNGFFAFEISNADTSEPVPPTPVPPTPVPPTPVPPTPVPPTPTPVPTAPGCDGRPSVQLKPGDPVRSIVASESEGTCFLLGNGDYRFGDVEPKDDMWFIGESQQGVVVNGYGYENAFHGTSADVLIRNFTLQNFDNDGGEQVRQEQSAIRGTRAIWQTTDAADRADRWVIEDMVIRHSHASAIFMGDNFVVRNNVLTDNGVTGIGGTRFIGGLVVGNEIARNGADQELGSGVNGGGIKFTLVDGEDRNLVIRDNVVRENSRGIWCDVGCNGVVIESNLVEDHFRGAIEYEISRNGVIRDNTVVNGLGYYSWNDNWPSGAIIVAESAHVLVEGNTILDSQSAITIRQVHRPAPGEDWLARQTNPAINYLTSHIIVRDNTVRNSPTLGASPGLGGQGEIDFNTVEFSNNSYDNPAAMEFWWNGRALTYAQWQQAGNS